MIKLITYKGELCRRKEGKQGNREKERRKEGIEF
jgi:hypothetical protein